MTTDAKIGLLLALVFIVAITFVINGLPEFLNKNKQTADTVSYVSHYNQQQPALVGPSRNIAPAMSHNSVVTVITETPKVDMNNPAQTRYQALMPAAQEAVKQTETADVNTVKKELVEIKPAQKVTAAQQEQPVVVYVVCPGDSLAEIAKKMYGPENGNKLTSIEKIYNANKDKLGSIDQIQVGQKLTIPPIENQAKALLKTGLFEKVSKITSPQTAQASQPVQPAKEQYKQYIVKESDSLWQIAQQQLGDGNRFSEIMQLNQSVLTDPEKLEIGMKLKLPAR
jgi:nucleoid-associated protein YgaU